MEITQGVPFESFGLSEPTLRAIANKHYQISTPVQAGCIPPMMAGKDVIAKAPTGTGKTMAFGIPIIEKIDAESEEVQAVILAPTRELALQITDEMRDIAVYHEGIRLVCLYGGQPIGKQINALKRRPQIVVATPGRLNDHIKRRTVDVRKARTVILDEADRMLDMGFIHDVTHLLDKMGARENLGMFSATISREVMDISWVYQRDPEEITVRHLKVEHRVHVVHVDAPAGYVGSHEDAQLAVPKLLHHLLPLALGDVSVDALGVQTAQLQKFGQPLGRPLGVAEADDPIIILMLDDTGDGVHLVVAVHLDAVLQDVGFVLLGRPHGDLLGVTLIDPRDVHHLAADGSGEHA